MTALRWLALWACISTMAAGRGPGTASGGTEPDGQKSERRPPAKTITYETFSFRVHPRLRPFAVRAKFVTDDGLRWIEEVEVTPPGAKRPTHVLQVHPVSTSISPDCVTVEDVNFDGYMDLRVLVDWGSSGLWYRYWLFDPRQTRFAAHKQLEALCYPRLDRPRKRVSTIAKGAGHGRIFVAREYEWRGDDLVCVYEVRQDWLPRKAHYLRVSRARQDGTLKVRKTEILSREDVEP